MILAKKLWKLVEIFDVSLGENIFDFYIRISWNCYIRDKNDLELSFIVSILVSLLKSKNDS